MKLFRSISSWQLRLLLGSLLCPFLVLVLSELTLVNSLANIAYDSMMRMRASRNAASPQVLLIETPPTRQLSANEISRLQRDLIEKLHAKLVVLYSGHTHLTDDKIPLLEANDKLVVAEREGSQASGRSRFPPTSLPTTDSGIFRTYPTATKNTSAGSLNLEASLSQVERGSLPQSIFVDFGLGLGGLPKTSLAALQKGELIEELVRDRYVLIGEKPLDNPALATPVSKRAQMSLLEYRGHALNTLLERSWITHMSTLPTLLLLFLITLISVPLYFRTTNKLSSVLTATLLVSYILASVCIFFVSSLTLPLVEMMLTQLLLFAFITRAKSIEAFKVLNRVRLQSEAKLEQHYWPKALLVTTDFWRHLEELFTMVLPIERCQFYVSQNGEGQFTLASTVDDHAHFTPAVIDIGQERWNESLKVDAVVRLDELLPQESAMPHVLTTPIRFAGETVGIVVVETLKETTVSDQVVRASLKQLAQDIAPLLQRKKRTAKMLDGTTSRWSLFSASPELTLYSEIAHTFDDSLLRIDKLEDLLEGLGTAAIVYDLFGRVLFVNEHMRELTDGEEISLFDYTASQLVSQLGQLNAEQTSSLLRSVIFQGEQAFLPIRLSERQNSRFTMRVGPLELPTDDMGREKQLEERGIVCEIADISAYSQLSELKGLLSQRLGLQIRNDLGVIEMGASILSEGNISSEERSELLSSVLRKVQSITQTLADCEKYLSMDSEVQNREQYPVDSRSLLGKALTEVQELAEERGIELKVIQPSVMSYSVASAEGLEDVFVSLLEVLIADATDNGVVNTEILETEDWIIHTLSNSGFGIPAERLKEYIFGSAPLAAKEFQRLRAAAEKVKSWGGTFEADSELGTGLHLSLRLPRFL